MSSNERSRPDDILVDIAEYVANYRISKPSAIEAARLCMLDAIACALDALDYPECTKLLGPVVPGTIVPHGSRVPGTAYELDPVTA
jgi:2-methylcitrate dehydratase